MVWRGTPVLLWKCGFRSQRNTTNTQDDRPSPEEPNGRAFRDREFFTRIIRLRQDPSIRNRERRILFSSFRALYVFVYGGELTVQDFQDLHEIISTCLSTMRVDISKSNKIEMRTIS